MLQYQHILIASDLEPDTFDLIDTARTISSDARISVVHAIPPVGFNYTGISAYVPDMEQYERIEAELLESKREHVQQMLDYHKVNDVAWDIEVGKPAKVINSYAGKYSCDLIMIGSHKDSKFRSLFGSTAKSILNEAPCDVLCVRLGTRELTK